LVLGEALAYPRVGIRERVLSLLVWLNFKRTRFEEEELALAIRDSGMLVAIGSKRASYGSAKIMVADDEWKELFGTLSKLATAIFVLPGPSESVMWEMSFV
jgi:hypothetical protein